MSDRLIRSSLKLAAAFNFSAAGLFAFPASAPAQLIGLPAEASPMYRVFLAFFICLLGGAYAWIASQPVINRPMLALGTIGKAAATPLGLALWLAGMLAPGVLLVAVGDLAFAALWFAWLRKTASS